MTVENIRVNELAKELNLTSKEVLAKFATLSIPVKTHSSSVTPDQVRRLKEFIANGSKIEVKKPKAFIVKKAKNTDTKPTVVEKETTKEVAKKIEKPERIERAEKTTSVHKPAQPASKIEVVRHQPNKLEIVRRAPKKPLNNERPERPDRPQNFHERNERPASRFNNNNGDRRPRFNNDRREGGFNGNNNGQNNGNGRPPFKKRFNQDGKPVEGGFDRNRRPGAPRPDNKTNDDKKPLERRIIPQEIYDKSGTRKKFEKKKGKDFHSKEEEQERISLEKAAAQKHKKKLHKEEEAEAITKVVVTQPMSISELSEKIQKTPAEIIKFLMLNGIMATVNQLIDVDVIKKVCAEFELEVVEEDVEAFMKEELKKEEKQKALQAVDKKLLKLRAPVVSIMGHVDHGKTTLLDSIRASKHKIVATEVGGITQSIGAYSVHVKDKKIVFLDTPGHEAFTEMRARGAKATDIAILVVAADDGIMPQTIEAINHARAAETPIIVAVNKIDKPGADPDRVLQQLTEHGLVPEEWGGDTITVKVSALNGTGIDELLDYILLLADVSDLRANPKAPASGVVIEANLDKGKGPVATLLVQNGTLRVGSCLVVGNVGGRVRALLSDAGERVQKAEPSTPVEILGLGEVPTAGDHFEVVGNEKKMKEIVAERKENERSRRLDAMIPAHMRRESAAGDEDIVQLNLIIKANTNGSAEAVAQAVTQLESKEIMPKLIHVGVGDISEADVMLASASNAIILGFGVKEDTNAESAADKEGVVIKKYDIIYQILEDLEKKMLSLLDPEIKEVSLGTAEVRQIFTVGKTTKIAGCYVTEGKIQKGKTAKVVREGKTVFEGTIDQLKRFKDDVKEVVQGYECGISFVKFNDILEGDIIEVSTTEEIERVSLD
ncbi:translation initiation factor IF-2 [bacterium]|nr:translation initiation factor IF-2 [bacterium]